MEHMCKIRPLWSLKSFRWTCIRGMLSWFCTFRITLWYMINRRVYYTGLLQSLHKTMHAGYLAHGLAHIFYSTNVTFRRSYGSGSICSHGNRSSDGGGRIICYCFNSNEILIIWKIVKQTAPQETHIFIVVLLSKFEIIPFSFKHSISKWIAISKGTGDLYQRS